MARRLLPTDPPGLTRSAKVDQALREIAQHEAAEADRLAATMCAVYVMEIPAYGRITDKVLLDDVRSVSEALVRLWLSFMCSGQPITPEALTPLLEGARRRAAQGVDLYSVLRAFRVGIRVMWHELMSAPEWRRPSLRAELAYVAELALDYTDLTSTEMAVAYLDEVARIARQREQRRSTLLELILAGPSSEAARGFAELERPHAVVVAQVAEGLPLERLDAIGATLEQGLEATLWTVRHESVIAAAPLPRAAGRGGLLQQLPAPDAVPGVLAVGVGGTARSARDTRQSYAEAVEALRVGPVLVPDGRAVYDFQEFAPAIALLAQPDQAARFVATALEPLDELADRRWVLPTLEAYVARQGRLKEAAALLGVHLNTVKYRLRELRAVLGPLLDDGDRAGALVLALRLRRFLGPDGANPARPAPTDAERSLARPPTGGAA